jgi:hypothetical protein
VELEGGEKADPRVRIAGPNESETVMLGNRRIGMAVQPPADALKVSSLRSTGPTRVQDETTRRDSPRHRIDVWRRALGRCEIPQQLLSLSIFNDQPATSIGDVTVHPETTNEEAEKRDVQPGGPSVAPGTYTAHISYRGHTDSTSVQVCPDPRTGGVTPEEREARRAMYGRLMARIETATKAADRLRKVKKTIEQVNVSSTAARTPPLRRSDGVDSLRGEALCLRREDTICVRGRPTAVRRPVSGPSQKFPCSLQ